MDDPLPTTPSSLPPDRPWVRVTSDLGFTTWLASQGISLACTTYQSGKLLLFGQKPNGVLSVFERDFGRCMGLWSDGQRIWMSTQYQMWRLENLLRPGELYGGYDRLYVPKLGITTGGLDIHDVVQEDSGRVVFAATHMNCLGTPDERYSFRPLWRPPFISGLHAEDRCHLNGLALEDGRCRYTTAVSTTDHCDGWRARRRDGGVLMELPSGDVLASGLSMPHSPRLHRGDIWLLNSGKGWFGRVDRATGTFEPYTFCPGYLRGLTFTGEYAIVGLSQPRDRSNFGDLELDEALQKLGAEAWCGIQVIDLEKRKVVHWVRIEGLVGELYDVVTLPGVVRPMAFGFRTDEIDRTLGLGDQGGL